VRSRERGSYGFPVFNIGLVEGTHNLIYFARQYGFLSGLVEKL
jgi:hypothetical protein